VLSLLNISEEVDNSIQTYIHGSVEDIYETNGAKYMLKRFNDPYNESKTYEFNNQTLAAYHTEKLDTLWIEYQNKKYVANMVQAKKDLVTFKKNEPDNGSIDLKQYIIPFVNADGKIEARLQSIQLNNKNELQNIEYYILVK
jgi:hypothetical protein